MKTFILLFLIIPTAYANKTEELQYCQLSAFYKSYGWLRGSIREATSAIPDEIDSSKRFLVIYPDMYKFEICKRYDCTNKTNSDDFKTYLNNKLHKDLYEGNLPISICNYDNNDFFDEIYSDLNEMHEMIDTCTKSKNPKKIAAEWLDISLKHLKNVKELRTEVNEKLKINTNKNKHCDVIPLINNLDISKKRNRLQSCQEYIKFYNYHEKLQKKCE